MGSVEHEDCKGMYSWWWDSHITPKNSKWLMENLTDMDAKIILMIKIIEEDADSFAKRAEMYYKRRPELMKLVEEFYRAYRALAERYDHAAGVLRQAHKTMAEAFPNQVPPIFLENDELHKDILGQFSSFLDACEKNGALHLESKSTCSRNVMQSESRDGKENGNPICLATLEKRSVGISTDEIEETDETEGEILWLNKALAELEAEKEVYARQFQKSLERLSNFETELNRRVNEAEMEAQSLKKSLSNLESEKEANLAQYQMAVEKIQELERALLCAQGDADGIKQCAVKAEIEAGLLQKDLIALEAEKEATVLERNRCLEKISNLEDKLVHSEENTKEIKEAAAVRCNHLLMTISNLEQELTRNRAQLLDFDLEKGSTKLKKSEEMCLLLERSNQTLQSALEALTKKMENQSEEMMEKQKEMGRLWTCVQEERLRFSEVQNCFQNLQNLHFEAQEQMRFLAMKLQEKTQLLEDMESHNRSLKDEIRKVHKENKNLSEVNMASSLLVKNLEDEILSMRETMQKLEADVEILIGERDSFLTKISDLKNELDCLKKRHCSVIEQVASVGLDPVCLGSAVKELLDRNLKLEEVCGLERREKVLLLEKLAASEELLKKDVLLESRILDLTVELEEYKCKLKTSEKSHESVLAESFTLISCLENTIHGSDELMGKKSFFKVSLSDENAAFEEKRDKAQDSEDSCLLNRITPSEDIERRRTVENLGVITASEDIERRFDVFQGQLGNLVRSYKELKVDYSVLKEERKSLISRIEELQLDLDREKQEHRCSVNLSQTRLADVEFKFLLLQQEAQSKDQEHEEDLERALYSHIHVFILQKFLQDLEGRNFSLTFRFQKLVDAWKFSQKQISFLEHENLEQHTELKLLSNKINVDRLALYQIAETLEICARKGFNHHIDSDHDLGDVLERIHSLQDSICKLEEDNVKLVIDKSVIALLLEQLGLEVMKLATEKKALDQELKIKSENFDVLKCGLQKVIEMNEELKWKFSEGIDKEHLLKAEILSAIENEKVELLRKLEDLKMEYTEIQTAREDQKKQIMKLSEDYSRQIRESSFLCDAKQLLEAELIVRSINEAFLEEENHQLIEAYRIASEARLLETEQLKEKAQHLEVENDQLQLQLACHMPVLLSLGECISSLEKCAGIHMEMQKSNKEVVKEMNLITEPHAGITNSFEDRTSMVAVGLSASQALQIRIKAIQEALQRVEGTPGRENVRLNAKQDALESSRYVKHIPRKKEKESIGDGLANDLKMRKPMPQMTVMDNGLLTKDIMLDQISEYFPYRTRKVCPAEAEDRMLELWETSDSSGIIDLKVGKAFNMFDVPSDYYFAEADREHEGCDPSREMLDEKELGIDKLEIPESLTEPRRVRNKRKILERLHGNIQKLTNLQITVQDLSKKVEIMGKNGSEKGIEYSNVKEQLKEAQLTITKLFDSNNKLIRNAERRLSTSDEKAGRDTDDRGCARRLLSEQARRGSEKIGKLQLEVQKIQFLLVKLDEEKDSKVRMRVFERKTRVLLRDYLHGRSRNKQPTRKKSSPFCSCVQLPSKRQ